jgi:MoxR-like ATPase
MGSPAMNLSATNTPIPPPDAASVDLPDVRKRMLANRRTLAALFHERSDILVALDVAAVAREHVLLVGPPGTAKSDLTRSWASQFAAVYREDLFTRQSTESDHLAFLDVKAFTNGDYVYRQDGKITQAHVAFCDEIFKANGGFLNALLGWLNERSGRGGYVSPLITAIGASNEFGEDESVAALEDRLLIRFWVEPIQHKAARLAFLGASAASRAPLVLQPVTVDELHAAHAASRALPFDPLVFEALADVQDALKGAGIYVSDRRMAKCVRILQAFAWLDGSTVVEIDHVDFLKHVLWRRPEDKPAVETALGAINRGMIGEIRQIVERTIDLYQQAKSQPNFKDRALVVASQIEASGREIRDRFGGKVPDRVKERAKGYLAELREAYEDCKKAADGLRV